jgi:hypothetical protein
MKTYEIITNEKELLNYIEWLPDCLEHEQFYLTLFARKKYCPDIPWIKSDKGQLVRKTAKKEFIFDKISQMECKLGAYKLDGHPVSQEALACYISVNPRDLWKATVRSIGQLAKVLECNGRNSNPQAECMSEIQKISGNRKFIIFDIDEKNDETLKIVIDLCDGYCDVVETRGGYHVFVRADKKDLFTDKMWYPKIAKFADQSGDLMSCPVGTYQGGHEVKFVYRMKEDDA